MKRISFVNQRETPILELELSLEAIDWLLEYLPPEDDVTMLLARISATASGEQK